MWKKEDLQLASYDGIDFDFVDITDGFKKSVVKFEYTYKDGADLEDAGLGPRSVSVSAVFMGEKYKNLKKFLEALKKQGPKEVIHPLFGTFLAIPETVSARHDESAYYADVSITFIEHLESTIVTTVRTVEGKKPVVETAVTDGLKSGEGGLNGTLPEITEAGIGEPGFMATLSGYSKAIRDKIRKVDAFVATCKGYINTATEPFKLITSVVAFATNLPGEVLGAIAGAIESVAGTYTSLLNAPGKFMDSLNFGLNKIESALGNFEGEPTLKAVWKTSKASALITAATIELKADEVKEKSGLTDIKQYSDVVLDEGKDNRTHIMTIEEIDKITTVARAAINEAIEAVREAYPDSSYEMEVALKAQALVVQEMADVIRLDRERIVDYEIPTDTSLHLLAFELYKDINQAVRLLRINNIPNPNFLNAGETIKVYANA